jgi:hypothetical protein
METFTHLFEEQPKPLSGMLNVLTVLTFIGCGLSYIGTIYGYFTSSNHEKQMAQMEDLREKAGDNEFAEKMMQGSIEMMEKTYQYRYVLLASGLIFTTFCLIGALQMRKQKKNGYPLYVIGELAPIVITGVLIGFSMMGGITTIFSGIVAIVFVILYTTQRKNLIYN